MKQMSLIPKLKAELEFGGSLIKGKRKSKRPLSIKKPIHLILKSNKASGKLAMSPSDLRIKNLIYKMAHRFNIKIYSEAANWSHLHLVIRIYRRSDYIKFIKALTGAMVLKLKAPKGFFDIRPYTKIGTWGKQFKTWMDYLTKNQLEARGFATSSKASVKRTKSKKENSKIKKKDTKLQKE